MTIRARRAPSEGPVPGWFVEDHDTRPSGVRRTPYPRADVISFNFSVPVGRGASSILLEVTSGSFEDVAKAMIAVNREATIRAFAAAILAEPEAKTEDDSE